MGTSIYRVDDRLIHGQITDAWVKCLSISNIMIVDDDMVQDKLAIRILGMAAPAKVNVQVVTVADMASLLMFHAENNGLKGGKTMVLFRSLFEVKKLLSKTGKVFDILYLGGIPSKLGRHEIKKNVFLSDDEVRLLQTIIAKYNISVVSKLLPSDTAVDVGELLR